MTRDDIDRIVEELRQTLLMKIGEGEANTPAKLAFKKAETEFEYGRISRAECPEWMYKEGVRDTCQLIRNWRGDDQQWTSRPNQIFDEAEKRGTA